RPPAGRLGNAVGGALPDCPSWISATALHSSAQCHAVRGAAEGAHRPRVPLFPDVHRSLWGDFVSHADREGRHPEADGALEHSATGGRIHGSKPAANGARQLKIATTAPTSCKSRSSPSTQSMVRSSKPKRKP